MIEKEKLYGMKRLEVSSSLVKAYLINMGKSFAFIGSLMGSFYLTKYFLGSNPFEDVFSTIGIPMDWVVYAILGFFALLLVITIFNTIALTSYSLVFEGDALTYSYGSFFKITKSTEIVNIIRVNFVEYRPFRVGDVVVEFTDTEERTLKVQYVSDAKEQCDLISKLITLKKSQKTQEVLEKGVV